MPGSVKFGVYVPEELARELEEIMRDTGISSKSRVVQEALRIYVNEHRWRAVGRVCGVIGVVYNHEVHGVDEKLTDVQHDYLDVIVATLHVHLDKEKCMLTIIVRGDSGKIKELINSINRLRGVLLTRTMLLESR